MTYKYKPPSGWRPESTRAELRAEFDRWNAQAGEIAVSDFDLPLAKSGDVTASVHFLLRHGRARPGEARQGEARRGPAGLGGARQGMARRGVARLGRVNSYQRKGHWKCRPITWF